MSELLDQLPASVANARSVEELARPLLQMLEAITGLESTYLTAIDEARGVQQVLYARNTSDMQIPEGLTVPWNDTLCRRALEGARTYTDDVPGCWPDSQAARELGIRTYASQPVRTTDGRLYGTLCAASSQSRPSTAEGERILALFAALIAQQVEREQLITQLAAANERLAALAATDTLTGLANRRALMAGLERMLAQGQRYGLPVQVAVIDLDGFKAINDAHGHAVGDQFLIAVAHRLRGLLRAGDLAARLGGDEFVVIAMGPHSDDDDAAERAATGALGERITQATQGRYDLDGASFEYGGASVGVAHLAPAAPVASADEALRRADEAMYVVKAARRSSAKARTLH